MRERIPPPEFVKNRSKNHVPKMNREPKNRVVMRFPALCTYLPVPLDDSTYTKYMDNTCSLVEFLCLLIQKSFFPQEHCLHDRRVLFPFIRCMVSTKYLCIIRSLNPLAQCRSPVRESRNAQINGYILQRCHRLSLSCHKVLQNLFLVIFRSSSFDSLPHRTD